MPTPSVVPCFIHPDRSREYTTTPVTAEPALLSTVSP